MKDWDGAAAIPGLDVFGTDPYWFLANVDPDAFLRAFAGKALAAAREHGLKTQIWVQAFRVPEGREEEMGGLPRSDVLQFVTDDGVTVSVRPSGTEPKIKFYFALGEPFKGSVARSKASLDRRYAALSRELFSSLGLS